MTRKNLRSDTALTPVDVVRDVVTMGGMLEDEDEPHTIQRLRKIGRGLQDAYDEIDD